MEFDHEYYLAAHPESKHLDHHGLQSHWMKNINTETNISILIHLFNEELLHEFLQYIKNIKLVFLKVNVIFTINENSKIDDFIFSYDASFKVIKMENKGVDIYPFLECIRYIRNNNIDTDFVLKLHTKISINESEDLKEWRKDLILPIVNINNLRVIQHYFKTVKNIGYIGAQKCSLPKNFDLDFQQNIDGINDLCEKFPHLEKNWQDFNGGNIFWISNETLTQYLTNDLIEYLIPKFSNGKPPCNLNNKGVFVEYLCERLFTGVFCYKKTNILVNDFKGTYRCIGKTDGIIDNSYFYQPSVFSSYTPENVITN